MNDGAPGHNIKRGGERGRKREAPGEAGKGRGAREGATRQEFHEACLCKEACLCRPFDLRFTCTVLFANNEHVSCQTQCRNAVRRITGVEYKAVQHGRSSECGKPQSIKGGGRRFPVSKSHFRCQDIYAPLLRCSWSDISRPQMIA